MILSGSGSVSHTQNRERGLEQNGSPEDFQFFVEYLHQQGIGILLDWVPSHFPKQETLVFVCNFTPMTRSGYRLGVPYAGDYYEVINSDATRYGGSGVENPQPMPSGSVPWQSCPHSILLTLPPLATVVLKRRTISPWDRNPYIAT